jgi:hypothetical protein
VFAILLGAWKTREDEKVEIREFIDKARDKTASYIRAMEESGIHIRPQVKDILDVIDGFSYQILRGYFHWKYKDGLVEGCLPYSCLADKFSKLQDIIARERPGSFDALEGYLI